MCGLAALYFLSASLFALDPAMIDAWFGPDPLFDAPHTTIAAAFAAFAGLFGTIALTIDEVGTYVGGVP